MRRNAAFTLAFFAICTVTLTEAATVKNPKKRAIFREHVTPELGGKIPTEAWRSDRLLLNRLQKDGIAVPDGIILEQRQHQVFPYLQRGSRPTYQVKVESNGHYLAMPLADTTYVIKQIWNHKPSVNHVMPPVFKPILTYLEFPTSAVEQPRAVPVYTPRKQAASQFSGKGYSSHFKTPSFSSHDITRYEDFTPHATAIPWDSFQSQYGGTQVFNDLDTFFTRWGSRVLRDTAKQLQPVPKPV